MQGEVADFGAQSVPVEVERRDLHAPAGGCLDGIDDGVAHAVVKPLAANHSHHRGRECQQRDRLPPRIHAAHFRPGSLECLRMEESLRSVGGARQPGAHLFIHLVADELLLEFGRDNRRG